MLKNIHFYNITYIFATVIKLAHLKTSTTIQTEVQLATEEEKTTPNNVTKIINFLSFKKSHTAFLVVARCHLRSSLQSRSLGPDRDWLPAMYSIASSAARTCYSCICSTVWLPCRQRHWTASSWFSPLVLSKQSPKIIIT